MKKQTVILSIFWFLGFVIFASAQTQYNLIEPLPGIPSVTSFPDFISRFIPFLLAFAALAAFVQIVFGGIMRATSGGNPSAIGDANDRIWQAILGLVLALATYLILNTINPDLVSLRFFPAPVEIKTTGDIITNPAEGINYKIQGVFNDLTECQSQCKSSFGCVKHPQQSGKFVCPQAIK